MSSSCQPSVSDCQKDCFSPFYLLHASHSENSCNTHVVGTLLPTCYNPFQFTLTLYSTYAYDCRYLE